jgi:hypothetical protein
MMYSVKLKKVDGKIKHTDKSKILYQQFINALKDGDEIEIYMSRVTDSGSLAQISKVHTCIRELAKESGYTFEEMKKIVKERSGLCFIITENGVQEEFCKSFAECTKDEMSLAIQACIEIGEIYNIILQ